MGWEKPLLKGRLHELPFKGPHVIAVVEDDEGFYGYSRIIDPCFNFVASDVPT